MQKEAKDKVYSPKQIAEFFGKTNQTVHNWIKSVLQPGDDYFLQHHPNSNLRPRYKITEKGFQKLQQHALQSGVIFPDPDEFDFGPIEYLRTESNSDIQGEDFILMEDQKEGKIDQNDSNEDTKTDQNFTNLINLLEIQSKTTEKLYQDQKALITYNQQLSNALLSLREEIASQQKQYNDKLSSVYDDLLDLQKQILAQQQKNNEKDAAIAELKKEIDDLKKIQEEPKRGFFSRFFKEK